MKKIIYLVFVGLSLSYLSVMAQCSDITGTVVANGEPLPGVSIRVKGKQTGTSTDAEGKFKLNVCIDDVLIFTYIGFSTMDVSVPKISELTVDLNTKRASFASVSAVSPSSYWAGATIATIGYNISDDHGGADNIVGGATLIINKIKHTYLKGNWAVIGNIGNFLSTVKPEDISKSISKIAQSNNGLSIGFGGVWEKKTGKDTLLAWRRFLIPRFTLNSFMNVGPDSATVSLPQFETTFGFEFEGFELSEGGKVQFGVAANLGLFSSSTYERIFNKKKGSLLSFAASSIIPVSRKFGVLLSGTYSKQFKPVYLFGIVIKSAN